MRKASIPDKDFLQLLAKIKEGLEKPDNKAAVFMAKASVFSLKGYSPSFIEAEKKRLT